MVVVGIQLSVVELYRPPVFNAPVVVPPAQMIISLPVHTPVCALRGEGALARLVATQPSFTGLYLPPVLVPWKVSSTPPQTIISLPVHIALCATRPGMVVFGTGVGVQVSVFGLYRAPVRK